MLIKAPANLKETVAYTLLLALLYYAVAHLSLILAIPPGYSTAFWPAAGLALAGVILLGNRVAGGIFIGSTLANVLVSQPNTELQDVQWLLPVLIAAGATAQAVITKALVSRYCQPPWEFLNTRQIFLLIVLGGPVGCLISATNGNLVLLGSGLIQAQEFLFSWLNWWVGDSLGVFVVTPLLLIWVQPETVIEKRRKYTVTAPMVALLVAITLLFNSSKNELQNELQQRLSSETSNILLNLEHQILINTRALNSLKSLYLSSEQVESDEFKKFAANLGRNIPSLLALEWAPRVTQEQLSQYQGERYPHIELKETVEGQLQPLSPRPYYQPITFLWPENDTNRNVLGYDLLSNASRKDSIEQALNSGEMIAVGPLSLIQQKTGYLLIEALDPDKSDDIILAVIDLENLFAAIQPMFWNRPIQISVMDLTVDTQLFGFANNRTFDEKIEITGLSQIVPTNEVTLKFGQRDLAFISTLDPSFVADEMYSRLWPVLTAGFAIAGCLSLLIISTTGSQVASVRLVKEKTQELEGDRQFLDTLIDNLPIILYVKDAKTREYVRFNKAASNYFKKTAQRLIGKTREEAFADRIKVPDTDPDDIVVLENRVVRERTSFHYRGHDYWFDSQKIPIHNAAGEVQYVLGLAEDITTETNTRRELQESKEYLSMVLNSVDEGIYGLDTNGKCTFVNEAACEMLGYRTSEWLGRNIHQIIHHKYKDGSPYPDEKCPILAVFEDGEVHHVSHEVFWHKNGAAIPIDYKSTPIIERDKVVGAVVVFSDISARKEVERLQKEHTQRLEQINQELEEFSYVASHDIQEPLRTLNCFCEFLAEDIGRDLPEQAQVDINYITDASQRMNLLINDMLEYSRAGRANLEMAKVPLQRCIENIKNDLFLLIKENQAKIIVSGGLPLLLGDEAQLTRVFQNLIHNAIKFRHPDRKPTVVIDQQADEDDEFVWVRVRDNGIGIESAFHEQIFGAFRRLHQNEEYSGSGIGLAVVKKLVERHGGSLRIESTPGEGTTFYIKLKKYPTESVMEEIAPPFYSSSQSSTS